MSDDSYTKLGEFNHAGRDEWEDPTERRWSLRRANTPSENWFEVWEYENSALVKTMSFPDHIAAKLAEAILAIAGCD